jgi:hypothetical protein
MVTKCKICDGKNEQLFSKTVLGKYDVKYHQCANCQFIQTEEPFWLSEAYKGGAIGALDVGIISRNIELRDKSLMILSSVFKDIDEFKGIDYGGGHGIYVRLMRDKGYDFYRQDLYAENLYARYFDVNDLPEKTEFSILTTFEVFEHLWNPIEEVKKMFEYSNIILFSTELQPYSDVENLKQWWYLVPEGGQHVSFYSLRALNQMAKVLNADFYSNGHNLHILSKTRLSEAPFKRKSNSKRNLLQKIVNKLNSKINNSFGNVKDNQKPSSLVSRDFEFVKSKINNL